jgi:hypothetical protein
MAGKNGCLNGRGGWKYVNLYDVTICTIGDNTSNSVQNI